MNAKSLIASLTLALLASAALAQSGTGVGQRIDNRQERQAARIAEGAASGQLTPHEHRKLAKQQKHIQRMEGKVEADGVVTPKEAVRLEQAQDAASRAVARNKHDRQRSGAN